MSPAAPASFRILALSGGGFLGLYTAAVLKGLEERAGEALGGRFDLIGGTSIGGVLALALAFERPMTRLVELFMQHGPEVFSSHALPSGAVSRLIDLTRSVLGPKYSGEALREALHAEFGDATLGEARHAVVIPAVDVHTCRTKVFKTPHAKASSGDAGLPVVEVAMAACAAPAYFPSVRLGGRLFADGGLFAVAPDQVALHEAEHFMGVEAEQVQMLSLGTAASHYQPSDGVREDAGAVNWLSEGRLIMTLLSAQQQHVQAMMEDRLGKRYLRLDAPWPRAAGLGIDVATEKAMKTLNALAEQTLRDAPARLLSGFLSVDK